MDIQLVLQGDPSLAGYGVLLFISILCHIEIVITDAALDQKASCISLSLEFSLPF